MGNKSPRPVGTSKIEAVSDSADGKLKGRLLSVEVVLTCDRNSGNCTVPFETKFVLTNGKCNMYYTMYVITIHCYRE